MHDRVAGARGPEGDVGAADRRCRHDGSAKEHRQYGDSSLEALRESLGSFQERKPPLTDERISGEKWQVGSFPHGVLNCAREVHWTVGAIAQPRFTLPLGEMWPIVLGCYGCVVPL